MHESCSFHSHTAMIVTRQIITNVALAVVNIVMWCLWTRIKINKSFHEEYATIFLPRIRHFSTAALHELISCLLVHHFEIHSMENRRSGKFSVNNFPPQFVRRKTFCLHISFHFRHTHNQHVSITISFNFFFPFSFFLSFLYRHHILQVSIYLTLSLFCVRHIAAAWIQYFCRVL